MLSAGNYYYPSFYATTRQRQLLLGYTYTPAATLLVHLSGFLLPVAIFTAKVVQFAPVSRVIAIVFTDEYYYWSFS